jgi:ubiquinone/menaquinone biosynthesis C-methylase UbiE
MKPNINTAGLSTERILTTTASEVLRCFPEHEALCHLDIGAGNGELIKIIKANIQTISHACDYTNELMELKDQKVDICDLNSSALPYEDNTFELITFTEVIEHIENHRFTLREIARILKPKGVFILSTPNLLNLKSRVRFLFCGFWNLFGPLKCGGRRIESTDGHINPIHYFYIAHSLIEAGLEVENETYDKFQSTSLFYYFLLFPFIKIYSFLHLKREKDKWGTIDDGNERFVKKVNQSQQLLSRTIVISARKT